MSDSDLKKFRDATVLEDLSALGCWEAHAEWLLPPVTVTGEFARDQIRQGYLFGMWSILQLERRLRRETPERRVTLLDRFEAECEVLLEGTIHDRLNFRWPRSPG